MTDQEIRYFLGSFRQFEGAKGSLKNNKKAETLLRRREGSAQLAMNAKQTAAKLLKIRLEWLLNQAKNPNENINGNLTSSNIFVLMQRNNFSSSSTLLSYTMRELEQKDGKIKSGRRKRSENVNCNKSIKMKKYAKQIPKLMRNQNPPQLPSPVTKLLGIETKLGKSETSGGPMRNKVERRLFCPYTVKRRRRTEKYDKNKMNEPSLFQNEDSGQEYHHNILSNNVLSFYHQYSACGLETLPEASSEEESLTTVKDDPFPIRQTSLSVGSVASLDFSLELDAIHSNKSQKRKCFEEFTAEQCETDVHKIFLLESIIQQLRDELRECKDQNELLEFRLLEIEETHSNNKQTSPNVPDETSAVRKTENSTELMPELEDVMRERSHPAATESRSSCSGSDCSESLSFQESGIFDGQGSDDGLPSPRSNKNHISQELANLTLQIEELIRRTNEGNYEKEKKCGVDSVDKSRFDLATDLSNCRQRIQEFEKRLSQMNDMTYIRRLEDKVNQLLVENKRLEEEKAEVEEAENDNRYLCQRLEEKVRQCKKSRQNLELELGEKKLQEERLLKQILMLHDDSLESSSKICELEGYVQGLEQKNFDLEESSIDLRCTNQILLRSLPVLSFYFAWANFSRWTSVDVSKYFYVPQYNKEKLCIAEMKTRNKRKHKLSEINDAQPMLKKCKNLLRDRLIDVVRQEELLSSSVLANSIAKSTQVEAINEIEASTQTGELWEEIVQQQITKELTEWAKTEVSRCQKIERLETEIGETVKMYEEKLGNMEQELKKALEAENYNRELQENWNCLIQELETFALHFSQSIGTCSSELENSTQLPLFSKISNEVEITESRLQLLDGNMRREELIPLLQSALREHLRRSEMREKQFVCEIDRLLSQIKSNSEASMVAHLMKENQRLESLFKDHDKLWNDFKIVQEENELLRLKLDETERARKRHEGNTKGDNDLRERLEEAERAEVSLKKELSLLERREQKGALKIQQLREELQFLRNKCCTLQDEIDAKVCREVKYKAEAQLLNGQLKEHKLELEEKEAQLESNEAALQTQIVKLKAQLQELYQSFTDSECSNGMLREEVSYLEKTVEEAIGKAFGAESTIGALSHELKQKDSLVEDLQSQLRQMEIVDSQSLPPGSPHELSELNNSEGGLNGVVRAVQEVMGLVQMDAEMMRYESDETLIPPTTPGKVVKEDSNCGNVPEHLADEDEILIGRLQMTMARLTGQIAKLEESLNIRQAELKEAHFVEIGCWKDRCDEKNMIILILARRIAHLSATDVEGHFINGILKELEVEFCKRHQTTPELRREFHQDFSLQALRSYLTSERSRILDLLEASSGFVQESGFEEDNPLSTQSGVGFRVVRKIGDDALLVSWTFPGSGNLGGYEIDVNGSTYLRIPKPNRYKAVLFGLNLEKPLRLTLKCPNSSLEESTITFIS